MAADGFWCYISVMSVLLAPSFWSCLVVSGEKVALMEVFLRDRLGVSCTLQGEVIEGSWSSKTLDDRDTQDSDTVRGSLRLLQDDEFDHQAKSENQEPWIGVVPVKIKESKISSGSQESFASAVVNKMKRALVLGASALIILALNQNTVREAAEGRVALRGANDVLLRALLKQISQMDLSQVLSKPIIVFQTSENVTKLIGVLLRGLHATARITFKTILQDNLGATLTLWSTCGRSRGGLYGEWQGVICTGETSSQVQKYLQQLWNTVLLVALILCTGVIVQARWQYRDRQLNDDMQLLPKQDVLKQLAALKTRKYHSPKTCNDQGQAGEAETCAVCLEQYFNNQCLRVLPCLHEFHRDCVDPWLQLQQTCPLCKRSILTNYCKDS